MDTDPLPAHTILFILADIFQHIGSGEWIALITTGLILAGLMFCSAMVAGSENAFFSLSPSEIKEIQESGTKGSRELVFLVEHPKLLLATILITNNFINIAFIIASEGFFSMIFTPEMMSTNGWFIFQVVFVTFVIVFFGEITPKIYATQNYFTFSHRMARPMKWLSRVWKPFVMILVNSTSVIDKRITKKGHMVTVDDLERAIDITNDADTHEEEKDILKSIVRFGNIDVGQIMRSRLDVKTLDISWTFDQVLKAVKEWGYSRMPVVEGTFDQVKGILNVKELLPHLEKGSSYSWQKLIKSAYFIPETKMIDSLFQEFKEKRVHMAVVIDEYGGSVGLVTMEDILEEIFGEIHDEFDEDENPYSRLDEHTYVFEGRILLVDLCRMLELPIEDFEEAKGEADTLGGLILELSGRIPSVGTMVDLKNYRFWVESVDKRRIKRVKMTLLQPEEGA